MVRTPTSIARKLALIGLLCVASAAGGLWGGVQWQRGRDAIVDKAALQAQVDALSQAAERIRAAGVDQVLNLQTSARRMDVLSTRYQGTLDDLNRSFGAQRLDFGRYLSSLRDQSGCRIGAVGLQWWTYYATGGASGAPARAAGVDSSDVDGAVSTGPADTAGRQPGSGSGHGGTHGPAVPPLPRRQGVAGGSGEDL